jgi:hypothetical protein
MKNIVFREIMASFRKNSMIFVFEINFHNFIKIRKLMLIELIARLKSPLRLKYFNSMLALLAI